MKRLVTRLVGLIVLASCASLALGQQPTPTPTRNIRDLVNMPVVYRVAGMDKVVIKPNLKYSDSDNPNLLLDVYIPHGLTKTARRPAVIFIHGSAGAEARAQKTGASRSSGLIGEMVRSISAVLVVSMRRTSTGRDGEEAPSVEILQQLPDA